MCLFLLSGCAGINRSKIEKLPNNTNILIVSAIGNFFNVSDDFLLSGYKKIDSIDVTSWQLNKSLENYIYDSLTKSRFNFYKFHDLNIKGGLELKQGKWIPTIDFELAKDRLVELSIKNNYDLILIISEDRNERGSLQFPGYGVTRNIMIKTQFGVLFACTKMSLYEANSMNKLMSTEFYETIDVHPEDIDKLYDHYNKDFFLSKKKLFMHLFKSNIDRELMVLGFQPEKLK
jgi:hypothetical protein